MCKSLKSVKPIELVEMGGGWQPYTSCLCTLQSNCNSSIQVIGLVPISFTDLHISSDILLESARFLKNGIYLLFLIQYKV